MSDHSPEPWHAVPYSGGMITNPMMFTIKTGDGRLVMAITTQADMDRIVACVNACAGIPTDELAKHGIAALAKEASRRAILLWQERVPEMLADFSKFPKDSFLDKISRSMPKDKP